MGRKRPIHRPDEPHGPLSGPFCEMWDGSIRHCVDLPDLILPPLIPPPNDDGGGGDGGSANEPNKHAVDDITKYSLPVYYGTHYDVRGIPFVLKQESDGCMTVAYAVCYGPINEITNIRVGGVPVADMGSGVEIKLGTNTQTKSSRIIDAAVVSSFPGIAYVVVRLLPPTNGESSQEVPSVSIFDMECDVSGLLIRDPRRDPTLSLRYLSNNPALIIADLLTNRRYGAGVPDAEVDWFSTLIEAANYCDEDLDPGGSVTLRYQCNFALTSQDELKSVIDKVRVHAGIFLATDNGVHLIIADKPRNASGIVFTDSGLNANIVSAFPVRQKGLREVPNHVVVTYMDLVTKKEGKAEYISPRVATEVEQESEASYDLRGCPTHDQASRTVTYIYNRKYLQDKAVQLVVNSEGIRPLPGAIVSVTSTQLNIANQLMILISSEGGDGMSWLLNLEYYDPLVYVDYIVLNQTPIIPATKSPSDVPLAPTNLSVLEELYSEQSGVYKTRLKITWTKSKDPHIGTEIKIKRGSDPEYSLGIYDTEIVYFDNPTQSVEHKVTARAVTSIGVRSTPIYVYYTPIGKNYNPNNPLSLLVSALADGTVKLQWIPYSDKDVELYELRYGPNNAYGWQSTIGWDTADYITQTRTNSHVFHAPPSTFLASPATAWRFYLKTIDKSKQYSTNASYVDAVVQAPVITSATGIYWPWAGTYDNLEIKSQTAGTDTLAIQEGQLLNYRRFILCRDISPADIDAEITANSYTSLQQWHDSLDFARTKGIGFWAPVAPNSVAQWVYEGSYSYGTSLRFLEYRVWMYYTSRSRKPASQFIDNPDALTVSELGVYNSGNPIMGPAFNSGPSGTPLQWIFRVATNNAYVQRVYQVLGTFIGSYVSWRTPVLISVQSVTTDSNGVATVTFPALPDTDCRPTVDLTVMNANSRIATITDRTSSTIAIKTWTSSTGAAVGSTDVLVKIYDSGEGGTYGVASP